jgi:murein L,D-transpeptidase YcbB/YkuD
VRAIRRGEDAARVVAELEPPFGGYRRALAALLRYRRLARDDDEAPLPIPRRPIAQGDRYPGVRRLTALLRRVGDLAPGAEGDETVYGADVAEAVARFQRRHGLAPDGRAAAATVARMNVPLARRARQLELVIERWRWAPKSLRAAPIVVNIPEFRLHVGDEGRRWSMRVVVGRAYSTHTPLFGGEVSSVVFRPVWKVPRFIARNELAPEVAKDPGYFARHGYEFVDTDGRRLPISAEGQVAASLLRSGGVRVRQAPGPRNALGLVKFVFPNAHDVYMHGTPSSALFGRSRRDLSHGCIRVEDPLRLAIWVLRGEPGWTVERIAAAMNASRTSEVRLSQPVPVLIVYGTALVAEDGTVSFFDDVYGQDASLERALEDVNA